MPPTRSTDRGMAHGTRVMLQGPTIYAEALAPLSHAQLCDRAVQAIWHILDEHNLLDEQVRGDLAAMLEPLAAPAFGDRPQRLIKILRHPNPIDPSHLYWLTRRLLTLVPELQAAAITSKELM